MTRPAGRTPIYYELLAACRKRDYRFRDEGYGAEADSWRSAIEIVSGRKGAR